MRCGTGQVEHGSPPGRLIRAVRCLGAAVCFGPEWQEPAGCRRRSGPVCGSGSDGLLTRFVSPENTPWCTGRVGGGVMADRAFLTRLKASDGPSHHLLVLLDQHRVMTTGQLARATSTPERTVRSRLERLRDAGLVDFVRPGRERGSAPRYWSLRRAGARLITGSAPASGTPS